jgi:hypothetical protein
LRRQRIPEQGSGVDLNSTAVARPSGLCLPKRDAIALRDGGDRPYLIVDDILAAARRATLAVSLDGLRPGGMKA